MHRLTLALSLGAFALLLGAQAGSPAGPIPGRPDEPAFSRARWIEEHEHELRLDGGALPGGERPAVELPELAVRASRTAAVSNVRVSADLLAPDGSTAQAETQAEPFLAIDPANERRMLAGFQENRFVEGGARALSYSFSTDTGRHWHQGLIPALTLATGGPWERASDPWVAFGSNGRAYYVSLAFDETRPDNAVVVSTSTNGGATWGDPVTVHRPSGTDFDDKEAIVVDNRRDSRFRGRVYVAWDRATETSGQPLMVSWSDDGGATFAPPLTVQGGVNIGVLPLVGKGGVVHLVWERFDAADHVELMTMRSSDGGATWSPAVHIADAFAAGVVDMRTGDGLPAAAVDARNGALYVVWQDARNTGAIDQVLLARSRDRGESWGEPIRVSDGPSDAPSFTPAVAVDGHGRVGVAYYSLRNDPSRSLGVDEYLTFSTNDGRSFTPSRRISRATWDATFAAFSGGKFLGDYQGLVAGARLFHALFVATYGASALDPDRRQPDVFTAGVR